MCRQEHYVFAALTYVAVSHLEMWLFPTLLAATMHCTSNAWHMHLTFTYHKRPTLKLLAAARFATRLSDNVVLYVKCMTSEHCCFCNFIHRHPTLKLLAAARFATRLRSPPTMHTAQVPVAVVASTMYLTCKWAQQAAHKHVPQHIAASLTPAASASAASATATAAATAARYTGMKSSSH